MAYYAGNVLQSEKQFQINDDEVSQNVKELLALQAKSFFKNLRALLITREEKEIKGVRDFVMSPFGTSTIDGLKNTSVRELLQLVEYESNEETFGNGSTLF